MEYDQKNTKYDIKCVKKNEMEWKATSLWDSEHSQHYTVIVSLQGRSQ